MLYLIHLDNKEQHFSSSFKSSLKFSFSHQQPYKFYVLFHLIMKNKVKFKGY